METIKTYLDNVFAGFADSEQLRLMKREMLAGMEEKYLALKAEGKSENEAIGCVIRDFGNIDEIARELELSPNGGVQARRDERAFLSGDEAAAYLADIVKASIAIGMAVWLILTGVAGLIFISQLPIDHAGNIGVVFLLTTAAVAVVIFIIMGLRMDKYADYAKLGIRLNSAAHERIEAERECFIPLFAGLVAGGVALLIIAVTLLILMGALGLSYFGPVLLLFMIGGATLMFIVGGMRKDAYDLLLMKGEYQNIARYKKGEKIIGTVASIYWPLAVAVYLAWSFGWDAWPISWLVWPIAGILFGAIAGGIGSWHSSKESD